MRSITDNGRVFIAIGIAVGLLIAAANYISPPAGAKSGAEPRDEAMNEKYSQTELANLQKVKSGFEAWANGTGSPYQILDENVSWTIVGSSLASKEYKSRKAFIDEVITPFNQRMSKPLVPTIRNIYADGDTVIVFFDAEGTAKDGKAYKNTYSWFLRLKNGRIEHAVAFFDSVRFNDFWTRVTPER